MGPAGCQWASRAQPALWGPVVGLGGRGAGPSGQGVGCRGQGCVCGGAVQPKQGLREGRGALGRHEAGVAVGPGGPPRGGRGVGQTPACGAQGCGLPLTSGLCSLRSVEGEAPSSEPGTSLDSPSAYHQGPLAPGSGLSPEPYEHAPGGAHGLYAGPPGQQQRARRPRLQHSTSILRKQAEEEAIKRSRSLSESYELSSDLQDKQVGAGHAGAGAGRGRGRGRGEAGRGEVGRGQGRGPP